MSLGANGLPITPNAYFTDPVFSRIGDAIAKHSVTVEHVDLEISCAFGSTFRCSTQALRRE
jgi:glycine amidinotransferase